MSSRPREERAAVPMGPDGEPDAFVRTRTRLFAIAQRIVGNVHDAEDILQEVWLRWYRVDRTAVINAEAFLATVTRRLAINLAQSAHRRHEASVALSPPEEAMHPDTEPQAEAERDDAIDLAVRLLLERLSPAERAAYALREGFDYPYLQIAQALQIGTAHARQLVKRARGRIATARPRPFSSSTHHLLVQAFALASRRGDLTRLEALLAVELKRAGRERGRNDHGRNLAQRSCGESAGVGRFSRSPRRRYSSSSSAARR